MPDHNLIDGHTRASFLTSHASIGFQAFVSNQRLRKKMFFDNQNYDESKTHVNNVSIIIMLCC